ncbi:MAG: FAD-dependent oxidoreductase [Thermodesulfovibrionales bacterium]
MNISDNTTATIIIGGGLTGLSAGCRLSSAGHPVKVFERDAGVGGLSKTIDRDGFRFDLGGHRFFTKDERVNRFVQDLLGDELIPVHRSSKIFMRNRFFDYPLKPLNALFGLGLMTTLRAVADYGAEKAKGMLRQPPQVSLEDWVVSNFGRTMFNIYFKEYSEKVWGIDCSRISADWVAQRIRGLSLSSAIKNAFFSFSGKDLPTLADHFLYPETGIGRIAERLREEIEKKSSVSTGTAVEQINHNGREVESIAVANDTWSGIVQGKEFISSMPLPRLVQLLNPLPPDDILEAASRLSFRDLVVVTIMVNRPRVTDQTWIYIPEKKIPFGRIHEPTNWSRKMAPEGKSLLVTEFFSFKGDRTWNETDERLAETTIDHLQGLGFITRKDVLDSAVIRAPKAYPLFEVGYEETCSRISGYLSRFRNLHIAGRVGMFRYYNMDHAIHSGLSTADRILARGAAGVAAREDEGALALAGIVR